MTQQKIHHPRVDKLKQEDTKIHQDDRFFKTVLNVNAERTHTEKVKVKVRCTML